LIDNCVESHAYDNPSDVYSVDGLCDNSQTSADRFRKLNDALKKTIDSVLSCLDKSVGVDDGSLQADSQSRSFGLVCLRVGSWCLVCIHRMNRVNSHNGLAMTCDSSINIGLVNLLLLVLTSFVGRYHLRSDFWWISGWLAAHYSVRIYINGDVLKLAPGKRSGRSAAVGLRSVLKY